VQTKQSAFGAQIAKASAASSSDATFVLASTVLDRDNDTIEQEALKNVAKNTSKLITLWQHKSDQPIGYWNDLTVAGNQLVGDLNLSSVNLGLMVKQLLADNVPLAASIGFMGAGEFNDIGGINYTAIELLECSIVSVPANPEAIQIAKHFGFEPSSVLETNGQFVSDRVSAAMINARRKVAAANLTRRRKCR
jgi:HK97 family phage prohead protease